MRLGIAVQPRLLSMMIGLLGLTASEAVAKSGDEGPELEYPACEPRYDEMEEELQLDKLAKNIGKRDAVGDTPASVKLAALLLDDEVYNTRPEVVDTVWRACWQSSYHDKQFRLPALGCAGDAATVAADLKSDLDDPDLDAYCAFDAMARLVYENLPGDKGLLAAAESGRGAALVALGTDYREEAIVAYEAAREAEPAPDRLLALAGLYIDNKQLNKANDVIGQLEGEDKASALVKLASKKKDDSEKLTLLNQARASSPDSPEVNFELGRVHKNLGQVAEARTAFEAVLDHQDEASTDTIANSHYWLAYLDALSAKSTADWTEVFERARRASDIQGGVDRYKQLLCLAHIGRGDFARGEESSPYCEGDNSPEGRLMQGMYWLRRAQFVTVILRSGRKHPSEVRYRNYLDYADDAFEAGSNALGPRDAQVTVDWPGVSERPKLSDALAFGDELVEWAGGFCRSNLDRDNRSAEVDAFDTYLALPADRCKPPRR